MYVDTGHNFPEVIAFRDRFVEQLGETLIVASVQDSIDRDRVVDETGPRASRNRLQTTTLLDAIAEHGFDAVVVRAAPRGGDDTGTGDNSGAGDGPGFDDDEGSETDEGEGDNDPADDFWITG